MKRYVHKENKDLEIIARDEVQESAIEKNGQFDFVDEVTQEDLDKRKK